MRSVVVLPHPDGPTRTRNSPAFTRRLRSSTAVSVPKILCTLSKRTSLSIYLTAPPKLNAPLK